jgi:hypothetical protein
LDASPPFDFRIEVAPQGGEEFWAGHRHALPFGRGPYSAVAHPLPTTILLVFRFGVQRQSGHFLMAFGEELTLSPLVCPGTDISVRSCDAQMERFVSFYVALCRPA